MCIRYAGQEREVPQCSGSTLSRLLGIAVLLLRSARKPPSKYPDSMFSKRCILLRHRRSPHELDFFHTYWLPGGHQVVAHLVECGRVFVPPWAEKHGGRCEAVLSGVGFADLFGLV